MGFFLEIDDCVGDCQLALEARKLLLRGKELALGAVEFRLPPRPLRRQALEVKAPFEP